MKLTKSELTKIITAIRMQCPESLNYRDDDELDILVNMWFECLKDYPKELVWQATRQAIMNSEYQKLNWLGVINKEIEKTLSIGQKTENDLWAELNSVLYKVYSLSCCFKYNLIESNGKTQGDNAKIKIQEIFDNLSPEIKEYLASVQILIDLAKMDGEQLQYEKGRFIKAIPNLRQRTKYRNNFAQLDTSAVLKISERI